MPMHVWMPTIRGHSGGDVFVDRLASGLRERGVTVTVEWFDQRYEFFPGLLARRNAPDGTTLIHANGLDGFAFRNHRLPLVVTEHHYVLDPAYRPYKSLAQSIYQRLVTGRASLRSMRAATKLTTHSRFVAATVREACPAIEPVVIPLWVDLEQFSPAPPTPRGELALRMLFVGNTSTRKGFDALAPLAEQLGPGYEIRCTGGLRGGEQGSGGRVRWLGRLSVDELVAAYRDCDVVLVPSRYEGFGYAALEAMACEKPVIAFACGAVDEVVDDGRTGFMVPVDDLEGMAAAARTLANDASLGMAMGRAGRERAAMVFSEEQGISAYLQVYCELHALASARVPQ